MVTLEKMAHLALTSRFDSLGESSTDVRKQNFIDPNQLDCGTNRQSFDKLSALGAGTRYDICTSSGCSEVRGVCHSFTHDGRCISLFKTLYTNQCSHQCNYCSNASNCEQKAKIFSYSPDELARLTMSLYRSNYIEGLFLSSGVGKDEEAIMEKLIETARLLRQKCLFSGYIHLKILPGASRSHIKEAMELSTRVSINLEASSASYMRDLSPSKDYNNDILQRQKYIRDLTESTPLPAGQTTQLVIGACEESDREIFNRILHEYKEFEIKRAYFSAFSPQKGTVFASKDPQPRWREHRLYQIDWLYRIYRFDPYEIEHAFDETGNLSNSDPKAAIAKQIMDFPMDPNSALYEELVRVPGIGPRSASKILDYRKKQRITRKSDLANLGVVIKRAAPFLKINGWRDTTLENWCA